MEILFLITQEKVLENRASLEHFKRLQSTTESESILSAISDHYAEAEAEK
eukprot:gene5558-9376_t